MRPRLRRAAIGILCAGCVAAALVGALFWAMRESPEERAEAELAARLTPQPGADGAGAAGLTAEAVVAALGDAGFRCGGFGTDISELPGNFAGAVQHCKCYVTMADREYGVHVLSYRDSTEAGRVVDKHNFGRRAMPDMMGCALSRGPIVLEVAPNIELVGKLRAILDGVPCR